MALLLAGWVAPLAAGTRTLYLRDVLNTHLPMKAAQAALLRAGEWLPLVDPQRAGGQPLLGNPNAVPLYPDNVLYLIGPVLWALNAHLWLHLLIALGAMYCMARAFDLSRTAAFAAALTYALCGYTLSTLNLYNLVAAVALAPGLVAAAIHCRRRPARKGPAVACGVLWALLLLGGEPLLAVLALLLAALAWAMVDGPAPRRRALGMPLVALALGTLAAAPQLVELARILPWSLRGIRGYGADGGVVGSLDPRQALDWLLPFPYGRPDLLQRGAFWGEAFYGGKPPIYFSLYPGVLAAALTLVSGLPGRSTPGTADCAGVARRWAWTAATVGFALGLGALNPLARPLFRLGLLRYPVKFFLLAAPALALLAGVGWERTVGSGRRARLGRVLLGLAGFWAVVWLALTLLPRAAADVLRRVVPARFDDGFVAGERLRWAGTSLLVLLVALALLGLERLSRAERRRWATGLLLGVHACGQFVLLRPLVATDEAARYQPPEVLLRGIPVTSRVVHGEFLNLFGPSRLGAMPLERSEMRFLERRAFAWLYPASGVLAGRSFDLDTSPEGLDSYLARAAQATVERLPDAARIWLLRGWGIDRLLLARPLDASADPQVAAVERFPGAGGEVSLYTLRQPAPSPRFVGTVQPAADINVALSYLLRPDFDPRQAAVVAGDGKPEPGPGGTLTLLAESVERLEMAVQAQGPGLVVVERAHLPIYRAFVDQAPAPIEIANLYRLGVRVPAGAHRVVIETDRGPTRWSAMAMGAGILGLFALAWRGWVERAGVGLR